VLAAQGLHEHGQHPGLSDDRQDADGSDEHGHGLFREVHHQTKVDEKAGILTYSKK